MAIRMCADKALTRLAVAERGCVGWCKVWDEAAGDYAVKEFVFSISAGKFGSWILVEQYRADKMKIKDDNRKFYNANPQLRARKILDKRGKRANIRDHGWPSIVLGQ